MSWSAEFEKYQEELAIKVLALRAIKKYSQEGLALRAGVDRTLVSKIERRLANPTLEVLVKIAFCLDVSVDQLLNR